ncbi:MAG: ORF6N domain-containing protein [Bacteroidetes bacterium]|nr:ORF6N domain-containing protein [Bacteroidota bacterium]
MEANLNLLPEEIVLRKILQIRGKKVLIDRDLAELYGTSAKRLNEQVKRNLKRFPNNFMFQLTEDEKDEVVAICDHLFKIKYSPYLPFAFTEYGVLMLANVLNSEKAIQTSIRIIEIFGKLRESLKMHDEIIQIIDNHEHKLSEHDDDIRQIFETLRTILNPPQSQRKQIGFKQQNKN